MDKNEAKLLLQAYRPNGQDAALPIFAEALALAERDPELKAWWEARQAFDRKISAKLLEIAPPAHLRASILAGSRITPRPPRYSFSHLLAIAAALALMALIGSVIFFPRTDHSPLLTVNGYDKAAIAFLGDDSPSLGTTSENHEKLETWLRKRHSPTGTIPANMDTIPSVGCQTFSVSGHSVSLICFSLADGGIVHLFIVEKSALADPPGTSPAFDQNGSWSTASWSDEGKSYLLVTEAGSDKLRHLL